MTTFLVILYLIGYILLVSLCFYSFLLDIINLPRIKKSEKVFKKMNYFYCILLVIFILGIGLTSWIGILLLIKQIKEDNDWYKLKNGE